ncbi:MAG: hypothetical protein AUI50_03730 [Crenarchaeota archaeon 13_1_40CM_2_52_14]|nr:MAG: hypothetical protein AUI97_01485 [Crenarchaeota archaeon 13_1_40CM_3_52_17]OLD35041.1 MAG: hypothetical protein AUI50_03730 [Crenarchaeota archaeon 13_1_40CM_2_52_14]
MIGVEQSSDQDTCPICGATVRKSNLRGHIEKVHWKRASSFSSDKPTAPKPGGSGNRHWRRLLFYGLLVTSIILISTVAALVISENTVRVQVQSQLSILIQGVPSTVPSGIGMNQSLWRDHSLDHFGVRGHSPLTTRDTSGTIYVESNTVRNFTLQEFLRVWGETVDNNQVVGYQVPQGDSSCIVVNGQTLPFASDVVLVDKQRITVEIIQGSCSNVS